ncbi:MAG: hypothetical protein ABI562_07280, partial [Chloroflexota bacterium]
MTTPHGPGTPESGIPRAGASAATAATDDPLAAAIVARLPGIRLLTDTLDREGYRDDETPYLHAGLPRAVVFPT